MTTIAVAESIMIGDSLTRPLTNDPIHGKIALKMKGSDNADKSEKTINAIGTEKYFFFITRKAAIDANMKVNALTIIL